MSEKELEGILKFLKSTEQLKNTLRNSRTSVGRHESTAEHTWRICLMALVFEKQYQDLDLLKLLKMIILHDLGEVIGGDIPAIDQIASVDKNEKERDDLRELMAPLSPDMQSDFLNLWDEYNHASSKEAILAKALDKIETILQHIQGENPPDFDHRFNLTYGKKYTDQDEVMAKLRKLIDAETESLTKTGGSKT